MVEYNINLESSYNNRKGIYVLTYTGKKPYKIGMTNAAIPKRINSYVNCPSQYDGHYIHMLLTWDLTSDLNALNVEKYIFDRIGGKKRLNSTQRKLAHKTEHFDVPLMDIKKAFQEAKAYYEPKYEIKMYLTEPKAKTVKVTKIVGKKNVLQ